MYESLKSDCYVTVELLAFYNSMHC